MSTTIERELEELGLVPDDRGIVTQVEEETDRFDAFDVAIEYIEQQIPGIKINDRGLLLPDGIEFAKIESLANALERMNASTPLLWGDVINHAERNYREEWTQILSDQIGRKEGTIRNWRWVASRVPLEERPDPRTVQITKLYQIAGLHTLSGMRMVIGMAEAESLRTEEVKAICELLKLYPADEKEEAEEAWAKTAIESGQPCAELTADIRADLIHRGHIVLDEEENEGSGASDITDSKGQTVNDLVQALLELAEDTGEDVPQNNIALFASMVHIGQKLALSESIDTVDAAYYTMGNVAGHLADLRKAQLRQGKSNVGCTCTISDIGGLDQMSDCPIHGWDRADEDEDEIEEDED